MIDDEGMIAILNGWYGRENAGDDAFFAVLCKWLVTTLEANRIEVTGIDAKLPKLTSELPRCIRGIDPDRSIGRLEQFLREPKNLLGKDIVIFGGGSIFSVRRFWWLAVQLMTLRTLRRLGLSSTILVAVGVSIGPFRKFHDNFWCRRALRQLDLTLVRDAHSGTIGKEYGLKNLLCSLDLALALPHYYQIPVRVTKEQDTSAPVIGFSVVDRDTASGSPEIDNAKRSALIAALLSVAEKYPRARFQGIVICKHPKAGDFFSHRENIATHARGGMQCEIGRIRQ